jgi:ABC transporter transmembrane region
MTDQSAQSPPQEWVIVFCLIAITIQLIRWSIDLIQGVSISQTARDDNAERLAASSVKVPSTPRSTGPSPSPSRPDTPLSMTESALLVGSKTQVTNNTPSAYGSIARKDEETPLLDSFDTLPNRASLPSSVWLTLSQRNLIFGGLWMWLCLLFVGAWVWNQKHHTTCFPAVLLLSTSATLLLELYLLACDWQRQRYGIFQRFFHISTALVLWSVSAVLWMSRDEHLASGSNLIDTGLLIATTLNVVATVLEGWVTARYIAPVQQPDKRKKKSLSWSSMVFLIMPYVWPNATDSSAMANRARAIATWVCVIASKVCGLVSPLYLGWSSTALAHLDYASCIRNAVLYCVISWLGTTLKEGQSLIYLKVAQAAFVQLSETAFGHLHSLSLDWHLRKKLGEVLRSMDRGIAACDTLMKYLFLWLIPAIAECLVVCIIFATYFKYLPLGVTVFYFVFAYIVWTILVTVWRKKFRKALVLSDNEWHDRFTDSLINFETVKFFTAEHYEMKRFAEAVSRYQAGSVHVQGSLSFLNISQQVLLKVCLALALSLSAIGIQQRIDCCVKTVGCESGVSECCQRVSQQVCPGSK